MSLGSLGDVIKESAQIAFVLKIAPTIDTNVVEKQDV